MEDVLLKYGVLGAVVIILLAAFKIYYNDVKEATKKAAEDIKDLQKCHAIDMKEIISSNQDQIKMRDEEFFHQLRKLTERMGEDRVQMKADREEGRQVLKEHNNLIMAIQNVVVETNAIVKEVARNQ